MLSLYIAKQDIMTPLVIVLPRSLQIFLNSF